MSPPTLGWLGALGHRLFGRHATSRRHELDRRRFRALDPSVPFETVVVRVYSLSWVAFLVAFVAGYLVASTVFATESGTRLLALAPGVETVTGSHRVGAAVGTAILTGSVAKLLTGLAAKASLEYLVRRRRIRIERTLPGAVRYMHVIAAGTTDPVALFEGVAEQSRIHGAAADSFESVLRRRAVTGSVETAIRQVARDTPSKDTLAPFLLTFLERTREGPDAVREYLQLESRLLASADQRQHRRETRYLTTVVELFVLLLVLPVVLLLLVVGAGTVLPEADLPIPVLPAPDFGSLLAVGGSLTVLVLGAAATFLVFLLRPAGYRWAPPSPSSRPVDVLGRSPRNPTNAFLVLGPVAVIAVVWLWLSGTPASLAVLVGYVGLGIPVGLVDVRRARRRAAVDRRLPTFVHAVARRLDAGVPFRRAVTRVSRTMDLGPLDRYVASLTYDLEVGANEDGVRRRALKRFVASIGTPLAGRTIGLAVGALEAGADTRAAFGAVQTETGRLVHADQARRSRFPVVIAVGWTVALLIVAIVVTMNLMVLDAATPISAGPIEGVVVEASFGTSERERPLFYLLTQATMLSSGWFAGVAGRGVYEALLHSGALVAVTYLVFRLAGLL